MIIHAIPGVVGTPPHVSLVPVAAMIITPWGKADPGNVWLVMSALGRMVQFPFRLQHSCIAKHNKWLNHWRKWEHATISAWERNRTGTSAWLSSDGPQRNKGFGSVPVIGVFPCFHISWSASTLKLPLTPAEVNTISLLSNNMLRNTGSWHITAIQHNKWGCLGLSKNIHVTSRNQNFWLEHCTPAKISAVYQEPVASPFQSAVSFKTQHVTVDMSVTHTFSHTGTLFNHFVEKFKRSLRLLTDDVLQKTALCLDTHSNTVVKFTSVYLNVSSSVEGCQVCVRVVTVLSCLLL